MATRIEIITKVNDTKSEIMKQKITSMGFPIQQAKVLEVYTINKELSSDQMTMVAKMLSNPISQEYKIDSPYSEIDFNFALEIGFLPGVTDNIATTARESIEDLFKSKFENQESVHSSTLILLKGDLTAANLETIGNALANSLIQRIHIKSREKFIEDNGMDTIIPLVHLANEPKADEVNLDIPEQELLKLGKEGIPNEDGSRRGPLALDKDYLETIKEYYKKEGRNPCDIELESLAQTWSEHCKHTIFAAEIDDNEKGLYKGYIQKATIDIRNQKGADDFCVSVFKDNSGGIIFDENWVVTDKAETHNSPSALDPFGGAITGIVGVNRDTIGFGKGAKPVINKYGFCIGNPDDNEPIYRDQEKTNRALTPKRILEGVVDGVNSGGNCSGIPTPQGFVCFNEDYKGKPLIFVGTVGLIPKEINGKPGWEKKAQKGDNIVMIGGRVGQDGIHGATFSSEALSSGSPATAVQIGDPITQKKFSDAIIKEARDKDLYNSITDNGAGGLSCSAAEMARECGGLIIELDKVPTKYPNLEPWKIWISESQERMTLSVPDEKLEEFMKLMEKHGVESTVVGKFTDSGRCVVNFNGEAIMDIDLDFLHDGLPRKKLKTVYKKTEHEEPNFPVPENLNQTLYKMLERPNLTSFEFISRQYDHTVQGGPVLGPLQGPGRVNSSASVSKPLLTSNKGVVCSQGVHPTYSHIDTYHMAAASIDTAIRNAVATGGDIDHMALMDNFCWCSSNEEQRLGQLKAAAEACYDYAVAFGAPYISGKDSMFNDFKGFDQNSDPIKISVPPTLLISSLSVMKDVTKAVSLDPKITGDLVYIIGETNQELGGSEYFDSHGYIGNSVPKVDAEKALKIYKKYNEAIDQRLIASALSPDKGGLLITLAKKAIASNLGLEINLKKVPTTADLRDDYLLFSESQSRFVITVAPEKAEKLEQLFSGLPIAKIGTVKELPTLKITGQDNKELISAPIETLSQHYKKTFKDY